MIQVHFTPEEIQQAYAKQKMLLEMKQGNTNGVLAQKNLHVIGELGEMAVRKYFEYCCLPNVKWSDKGYSKYASDDYDFMIGRDRGDVKTSKKWWGISINSRQRDLALNKKNTKYLVGVNFASEELCIIIGFGYPQDLVRDPEKDFEYNGVYKEMYSIPKDKIYQFRISECHIY